MFQTTLSGMFGSIAALRQKQLRWTFAYWLRAMGLMPSSGKWMERITFVYIYVLIISVMTPAIVGLLNSLYVLESKAAPDVLARTMLTTLPAIIAVLSVFLLVMPWRAWMLRLTFGDMTYLSPSPFDRRVLTMWRFIEVVIFITLFTVFPFVFLAPLFGSILAASIIPAVLRGMAAMALWITPMLALGWHMSLQDYVTTPPPGGIRLIARLGVIVAVGVLLVTNPQVLLLPGRVVMLLAMGKASWAWLLFAAYAAAGIGIIWITSRHLSLTRASAASDVFARIGQLGFMILLDRQLLVSIIGEARANESRAVGELPPAVGIYTALARTALFYRRQYGQSITLILYGVLFGVGLVVWRPFNIAITVVTAILLALVLPPQLATVFRRDQSVPFITQFIPQPMTRRLLASSLTPALLMAAGMLPVLLVFNTYVDPVSWGIVPVVWILSLVGHVESVGKHGTLSERSLFSVLMAAIAVFVVFWTAGSSGFQGAFGLLGGAAVTLSMSLALLFITEIRKDGLNPYQGANSELSTAKK